MSNHVPSDTHQYVRHTSWLWKKTLPSKNYWNRLSVVCHFWHTYMDNNFQGNEASNRMAAFNRLGLGISSKIGISWALTNQIHMDQCHSFARGIIGQRSNQSLAGGLLFKTPKQGCLKWSRNQNINQWSFYWSLVFELRFVSHVSNFRSFHLRNAEKRNKIVRRYILAYFYEKCCRDGWICSDICLRLLHCVLHSLDRFSIYSIICDAIQR